MDNNNQDTPQEHSYGVAPTRLNLADLGATLATLLKGIAEAQVEAWGYLEIALLAHSAHIAEKQAFARHAGRDLETITTKDNPDGI